MGALRINTNQLAQLQSMRSQLNSGVTVKDIWNKLASFGDTYAAAAVEVFTPGTLPWNIVRSVWDSSGADFSKFNTVAEKHLQNYLKEIGRDGNKVGADFKLPSKLRVTNSGSGLPFPTITIPH